LKKDLKLSEYRFFYYKKLKYQPGADTLRSSLLRGHCPSWRSVGDSCTTIKQIKAT